MTRGNSIKYIGFGALLLGLLYSMYVYTNLRTTLEDTNEQLSKTKQQKKEISDQLAVMKEHIDRLDIQQTETRNKLQQMERLKDEESSRAGKLESSLTQKETELTEAQTELGRIRKEHEEHEEECNDRIAKQQSEFESLQRAKQAAEAECQNSKQMGIQEVQTLQATNQRLQDSINDLKQRVNNQLSNLNLNQGVGQGVVAKQPMGQSNLNQQPVALNSNHQPLQQQQQQIVQQQQPQFPQQQQGIKGFQSNQLNEQAANVQNGNAQIKANMLGAPAGTQKQAVLADIIGIGSIPKPQGNAIPVNQRVLSNEDIKQPLQNIHETHEGNQAIGQPQQNQLNSQQNGNDAPPGEEMADGALVAEEDRFDSFNAQPRN